MHGINGTTPHNEYTTPHNEYTSPHNEYTIPHNEYTTRQVATGLSFIFLGVAQNIPM